MLVTTEETKLSIKLRACQSRALQAYGLSPEEWGVWFVSASDVQPNCVGIDYACCVAASWESPYACKAMLCKPMV